MMNHASSQGQRAAARLRNFDRAAFLSRYATLIALTCLIAFNLVHTPNFTTIETLNINLTQVAGIVIVAVGMTLVIATGGIDLSVGSLMAIAGAIAPLVFTGNAFGGNVHLAVAVAVVAALAAGGLLGLFNGVLVARLRVQPIIATLILFIAGRGLAQVLTNGSVQTFSVPAFDWIGRGRAFGIPAQVLLMAVIVLVTAWSLRKTVFGRYVLAAGGNERSATLAGLPVTRIKLLVYAISGLCAGLAGLVVVAINSSSDANQVGNGMELDAIAAVAVGGTSLSGGKATIAGTLFGALTIQLVRYTLLANGVPDAAALVVKAAIIAFAVWLQQQGSQS
ncbi:ABC transporter permease [Paraburkholderia sp. CNPSo 3272]|uniref:ABC transporter permease n=1 Tax=Paraburkholderia sp. CNPSo 3272 TaxID=2940931 RepID=UPI0020B8E3D1|nr:ABC transporter permease [Paraburkholderia sp. CNPSo 3272]MCP3722412.1 ABC transporter permease [Paraburkholderia sp. CNPSo 3272]